MMETVQKQNSDLKQRAYQFSLDVIRLIDALPKKRSSWVIGDQLMCSATSIGANLAEGRASSSRIEFKRYNEIALKSANETVYWLNLLLDAKLTSEKLIKPLLIECRELSNMLAAGIIKLKRL